MPRAIHVVVGAQAGSESKGRVTGSLVERILQTAPDAAVTVIRVAGPNAGHVVWAVPPKAIVEADLATSPTRPPMERFAMRQIPVGFVHPRTRLYIGPGSEINVAVLEEELNLLETAGFEIRSRLYISPQATILDEDHIRRETDLVRAIGSTGKGVGAARADRLMRNAQLAGDNLLLRELLPSTAFVELHDRINDDPKEIVVIEGTQGYALGLHAGFYPKCTSSDCRAVDFIAMSGVSPWSRGMANSSPRIHMVLRPFPIRVAGDSGPLAGETTWEELGLPPEKTTVTQKIRRVGRFDPAAVLDAVRANGVEATHLHLAMTDQLLPNLRFMDAPSDLAVLAPPDRQKLVDFLRSVPHNNLLLSLGTGPASQIWFNSTEVQDLINPGYRNSGLRNSNVAPVTGRVLETDLSQ